MSKRSDVDIEETIKTFSDTVIAFSKSLYNVDDVVEVNNIVMRQLAIRDGYIDNI